MPSGLGQAEREGRAGTGRAYDAGLGGCRTDVFRELGAQGCCAPSSTGLAPLVLKPDTRAGRRSACRSSVAPRTCRLRWSAASPYAETVLVERFVEGTEVAVSVVHDFMGATASRAPCRRSRSRCRPASTTTSCRYTLGAVAFHRPARLPTTCWQPWRSPALAAPAARHATPPGWTPSSTRPVPGTS
ncbi:hypothetical protein HBB16_07935 [Pseudonocardia sp. MCCB 268]|nr:hypothetical protein [Pseudonocardia cytotoxica]